uniref:G-protein coupled receptors family 1 profile domain-containing protein n=1 Tax=Anopheles culicifacies TaxID=139723 RepID=A0A182LU19_9DIPT
MESVLTRFNLTLDNMTTLSSNIRQGLIEQYSNNRKVADPWYHILIVMYGTLIVFGATGNSLVVLAVARKPQMRTARNMFIVNLAVSVKFRSCAGREEGTVERFDSENVKPPVSAHRCGMLSNQNGSVE